MSALLLGNIRISSSKRYKVQTTKRIFEVNSSLWKIIAFPDIPTSIHPLIAHWGKCARRPPLATSEPRESYIINLAYLLPLVKQKERTDIEEATNTVRHRWKF